MIRLFKRLGRDECGASIIEMGLLAPFLATLTIGMVDISRGYSDKLFLEQVAHRAVEKAMQGMQGDDSTAIFNTLKAEAATAAGVPQSNVTVRYWLECNGVDQNTSPSTMAADYDKKCPDGQYYSRHLSVRIQKAYSPMFATKWAGANSDGSYDLVGEAGLRVQ